MSDGSPSRSVEPAPLSLLRDADYGWVRRTGQGANWMFLGLLLSFCTSSLADRVPYAGPIINLLPDAVWFVGVWMLTWPEPGESQDGIGLRQFTRALSALVIATDVIAAGLSYVSGLDSLSLRGAAFALGGCQLLCVAFYLARLAERIPDQPLARQSRVVSAGLAVISVVLGSFVAYAEANNAVREAIRGNLALIVAAVPVVLITFVLGFWFLWILHRFRTLAEAVRSGITSPN